MANELPPDKKPKQPVSHGPVRASWLTGGGGVPNSPPPPVSPVVIDTSKQTTSPLPTVSASVGQ